MNASGLPGLYGRGPAGKQVELAKRGETWDTTGQSPWPPLIFGSDGPSRSRISLFVSHFSHPVAPPLSYKEHKKYTYNYLFIYIYYITLFIWYIMYFVYLVYFTYFVYILYVIYIFYSLYITVMLEVGTTFCGSIESNRLDWIDWIGWTDLTDQSH